MARSYPLLLKPDYPPSVLVPVLPRISRAQPTLVACGSYYVVVDGARAVLPGTAHPAAAPGRGHVRHVVTGHARTRQGSAGADGPCAGRGKGAGLSALDCLSTLTAVPFYRAIGVAALGPVAVPLGPGIVFPAVGMEYAL